MQLSSALILSGALLLSFALPLFAMTSSANEAEARCKHSDRARGWKKCTFRPRASLEAFHSFDDLHVVRDILRGEIERAPNNAVRCYGLKLYFRESTAPCPATCRLKDQTSQGTCHNSSNKLLRVITSNARPIVSVQSIDYTCSTRYPRRYMCIYSINMSACNSGLIKVNTDSQIDIEAPDSNGVCNDFIQVLEHNGRQHKKVCGSSWPQEQRTIHATNFALLFWSGQNNARGRGFRLQLECHNPTPLATQAPQMGSSAPLETPTEQSSGEVFLTTN